MLTSAVVGDTGDFCIGVDTTTACTDLQQVLIKATAAVATRFIGQVTLPAASILGFHTINAVENTPVGTTTFNQSLQGALSATIRM
jgi:hypothetical protein